jgi:putative methionine-R-sulfoxide reductase with GAF domain
MPDDAAALFLARAEVRLASLAAALGQAPTPRSVAWVLCEFAGRELALVDVVVYLRESDGDLVQQAAWGPKRAADHVLESRISLAIGQGVVGSCAKLLTPQRVADTRRDPRYVVDDQTNLSELAVPIVRDGALLGVLDSEHPQADYFDDRHERAMLMFADCAAARLQAFAG